jgi:hypothetical protein
MALHKTAVNKAWYLFRDMLEAEKMRINSFIVVFDKEANAVTTGIIFGYGRKYDEGWENLFIQLEDSTPEQRRIWEEGKIKYLTAIGNPKRMNTGFGR